MSRVRSARLHAGSLLPATLLTVALLFSPLATATAAQEDEPLRVVASFSVLADIVRQVGGDHVEVTSLVPAGGDAHTFDPSPDQVRTLENADLIVQVGDDFEPWLDDLATAAGDDVHRHEAFGDAIDHGDERADDEHDAHDNEAGEHADEQHDAHDDEAGEHADDGHEHHGDGIHHWLDVQTTIHTVTHLAEALAEIDPDNAEAYLTNADTYNAELAELDAWIVEQTETLPEDRRQLITVHRSMDAFAEAYGYEIAGVLLESHSTEGADAPAGHVAELVGIIQEHDIPAVFPDTPGGSALLEPLATEAGVEIAPDLYIDTLGTDDDRPGSYVEMMRYNVETIITALGR
jgi:zinc/manganese transport system substrate-binding protein